jgi:GT2 family glycosyltransferase
VNLSVIIACHNRKALTVRCIERAQIAADNAGAKVSFTVFDDGSTDGTAEAISTLPISLRILTGDGSAYWANSMAQAETSALSSASGSDDFIVWLNDDVAVDDEAFLSLLETARKAPCSVIVGAMRDPATDVVTYSGMRRTGIHPLSFTMITPSCHIQPIEAFNGNLVLVPVSVAKSLGGIDGGFSHALADIDYGLRCQRAGIPVALAPGTFGTCPRNPPIIPGTLFQDWARFVGPKGGGNFKSLRRILGKGQRNSWLVFISSTYILWWIREIKRRITAQIQ